MPDDKPVCCDISDEAGRTQFNWPLFLLVIAVASVLCFWGLGTRTLWEDEAETAVLAQRVLSYGFPKALSGNNLVYQGVPQYDAGYRWTYHPWGQFYVTAAGLAIFGQNAFAARFPFALCGVLTVALLYVFIWRHWHSSTIAVLGAMFLATSVYFILHCRQCRYYGLSAFTCLIVVAGFVEVVNNPCRRWWIGLGLALAAQFYTDFGTLMVMLPGLLLSLLLIRVGKKETIAAAKSFALAFLLIIPGLMLHWERLTSTSGGFYGFFKTLLVYIFYFDAWFIPIAFAVPTAGAFIWRLFRNKAKCVSEQDHIIIICTLVMVSAVIVMAKAAPAPYLRYVVPQLSLAKLLLALIIAGLYGKLRRTVLSLWSTRLFLTIVITTLVFTNIFSLPLQYLIGTAKYPKPKISPPPGLFTGIEFAGLMYELTHDFVCCNRVALNVVDDLAEADETVLIDSGDLPLMFYRPDLNIYSLNTLSQLHKVPDLIISYRSNYYHSDEIDNFIQKLQAANKGDYLCVTISAPEELCGNIPEPDEHDFVTPSGRIPFEVNLRSNHQNRLQKLPQTIEEHEARWFRQR